MPTVPWGIEHGFDRSGQGLPEKNLFSRKTYSGRVVTFEEKRK